MCSQHRCALFARLTKGGQTDRTQLTYNIWVDKVHWVLARFDRMVMRFVGHLVEDASFTQAYILVVSCVKSMLVHILGGFLIFCSPMCPMQLCQAVGFSSTAYAMRATEKISVDGAGLTK